MCQFIGSAFFRGPGWDRTVHGWARVIVLVHEKATKTCKIWQQRACIIVDIPDDSTTRVHESYYIRHWGCEEFFQEFEYYIYINFFSS